jgi:16S rRNA (adenine1518-N6/adenine1519-N6)-dimethyltransferase
MVKRVAKGQVFLEDNEVLRRIADIAALTPEDICLEIGMGRGQLTQHLIRRAKEVVAVEVEERFVDAGAAVFAAYDNLTVVHANILDADWDELVPAGERVVVAGNIPFYITGPILRVLFEQRDRIRRWTLMMQREVADRICARPGTRSYGALSVKMQFWGRPRFQFVVPATAFEPIPEVDAAVVTYSYQAPPADLKRIHLFDPFADFLFGGRRRKLGNRLDLLINGDARRERLRAAVAAAGCDLEARPERLTIDDCVTLFRAAEPFLEV